MVLDDISIEFLTGKTNLIIGRSGSGKTVLLKTLVGLHEPIRATCGTTIRISRVSIPRARAIRKDIGMIFQGGALLDSSTVEENVKLPLDLFTRRARKRRWNVWISACSACGWKTPTTSIPPSCRAE